jgi:starch-binding outer membrane protein, SusD/RagB family
MKIFNLNIKNSIFASIAVGMIAIGCEKKLDVQPFQTLSDDKALLTESDVSGTLVGAYDAVSSAAAYGGDMMILNDLIGNKTNISFRGTFQGLTEAYNTQMISTNSFAAGTWSSAYNAINVANNVLENVSKVTSSATRKNSVEGQALFLRASMYFELVKLYAKPFNDGDPTTNLGVPLVLTATKAPITDADYKARATVRAVYDQVVADLIKAESLMPSTNTKFATKWAAAAQLSRVYLMLGNYTEAAAAANRVIAGSGKSITPEFKNNWFTYINFGGVTPNEYIFYIKVTNQDGANSFNTYYGAPLGAFPGSAGRRDMRIQNAHLNIYETGDLRGAFFTGSGATRYTLKHLDRFGDVPVIRLAEMYLTRAEANFRQNTSVGATPLADVNLIRKRAGLADLTAVTLDAILKERAAELAFEGNNLFEAQRLKKSIATTAWNSVKLIMPIPQREMDVNKNLVQNEGYSN